MKKLMLLCLISCLSVFSKNLQDHKFIIDSNPHDIYNVLPTLK